MVGQANIINKFAGVRMEEIRGIRVPFLRVGWNRQFLMMKEFGFVYDASMVAPHSNPPLWPYTLDFKMPHSCVGNNQNCPTRSYPGIWELVMNQLEAGEYTCGMVDSCPPHLSGDDVYRMLTYNFKRHYLSNRAPFGLYFHSTWFKKIDYLNAFLVSLGEDCGVYPSVTDSFFLLEIHGRHAKVARCVLRNQSAVHTMDAATHGEQSNASVRALALPGQQTARAARTGLPGAQCMQGAQSCLAGGSLFLHVHGVPGTVSLDTQRIRSRIAYCLVLNCIYNMIHILYIFINLNVYANRVCLWGNLSLVADAPLSIAL